MGFDSDLLVRIGADFSDYERGMQDSLKIAQKASAQFSDLGRRMSMMITLPLAATAAAITKFGGGFEKEMAKSTAIMSDVSKSMEKDLALTAQKVAEQTEFSTKQAAEAYFFLASAGLSAAQSIKALPQVAKFATAGQFDLALATDLLTDAQSALGLKSADVATNMKNMARVSDVLVKANSKANGSVQQFSEALTTKAGNALKFLKKDLEEGVAVLAVYADQGIKSARAGNFLNITMRDLSRAADNNKSAFLRANVAVFDASGKMRNMADIVQDLENRLGPMSDAQKRAELTALGLTDKSIAATVALLGTSKEIRRYEKELRNAAGTTDKVAAKQLANFNSQMSMLFSKVQNAAITAFPGFAAALGNTVIPAVEFAIRIIKGLSNAWSKLPEGIQTTIVVLGGILAAIGPVMIGLGSMIGLAVALKLTFGLAKITFGLAGKSMLAMSGAATILVAKILALVAIGIFLAANWEKVKSLMTALFTGIAAAWLWAIGKILKGYAWLVQKIPFLSKKFKVAGDAVSGASALMADKFTESATKINEGGSWIGNTADYVRTKMAKITLAFADAKISSDAFTTGVQAGFEQVAINVPTILDRIMEKFRAWGAKMKAASGKLAEDMTGAFIGMTTGMVAALASGTFDATKMFFAMASKMLEMTVSFAITEMGIFQALSKAIALAFANPIIAIAAIAGLIAAVSAMSGNFKGSVSMAKGGVTNGPTNILAGDNPSGQEAFIPLDNPRATGKIAAAIGGGGGGGITVINELDGEVLSRVVLERAPGVLRLQGASYGT